MDLEERWASYQCQAFLMAFLGTVLFHSSSRAINFSILPLVSALPHGTTFIFALLSKTIRSLSLCRETIRGRLGCCVHMLQLWFYHLSVIVRDQPMGFVCRNKFQSTVFLNLPFSRDQVGYYQLARADPLCWLARYSLGGHLGVRRVFPRCGHKAIWRHSAHSLTQ